MIRTELRRDGRHLRVVIEAPKANILSIAVMRELRRVVANVGATPQVALMTMEGAGDHFSYGASVEEHRRNLIATALSELHGLIRDLLTCPAPTAAIVRGRCLGGGFELALACDLVFAGTTAVLGTPEISLGVFPPAASVLLPLKVGASRAAAAVLTGRTPEADAWMRDGLIELIAPPEELQAEVDQWFDTHLAGRSAAALRCASLACRTGVIRQVETTLPEVERLYLDTLMRTHDANEGIDAFIEKRAPQWTHA